MNDYGVMPVEEFAEEMLRREVERLRADAADDIRQAEWALESARNRAKGVDKYEVAPRLAEIDRLRTNRLKRATRRQVDK